jgi:hypothetical protein
VLLAIGVVVVLWQYRRAMREAVDRLAPMPQKVVLEVRLPTDLRDGGQRMRRVWGRLAPLTGAEQAARAAGSGQIDFIYLAEARANETTPLLRSFIVCDPQAANTVKKALTVAFDKAAEIIQVQHDPLLEEFELLRSQARREQERELDHGGEPEEPLAGLPPQEREPLVASLPAQERTPPAEADR